MNLSPLQLRIGLCALLFVTTFAVFAQVRGHDFVDTDDPRYILHNPMLERGIGTESLVQAFTTGNDPNWIPLTWTSLMIDHELYGLDAGGYLLTNVLLHAMSAIVLFLALTQMTGSVLPSAFVAAVFALHPLHVESVAWVTERKDTLSGLFWMLTLLAYGRYATTRSGRSYAAVFVFLVLGLMSKAILVTLPFVLLLLDFWPLRRLTGDDAGRLIDPVALRRCVVEKLPMFALVAVVSVITYLVQQQWGAMGGEGTEIDLQYRIANALESYLIYIGMAVWPVDLANIYPHPLESISMLSVSLCTLVLIVVTGLAISQMSKRPYLVVGWLWYLGTLVPVIGLVKVGMQARADRYMYLPLIGLSLAVAWSVAEFVGTNVTRRRAVLALATATLVALAGASWVQVGYWRNALALEQRAADVVPRNFLAHARIGAIYHSRAQYDEALLHYEQAREFEPRYSVSHIRIAEILSLRGELGKAIESYEKALKLEPRNVTTLTALGVIHARKGDSGRARDYYRESLRVDPSQLAVANNLAWILATSTDPTVRAPEEAVRLAFQATQSESTSNAGMLDTLGVAYAAAGNFSDAIRVTERAFELSRVAGPRAVTDEIARHLAKFRSGEAIYER